MFLTSLSLLGSACVERGIDSVTLDLEVFGKSILSKRWKAARQGLHRIVSCGE